MNKFLAKIVAITAGFALAAGIGVGGILSQSSEASPVFADGTATATASVTSGNRYYITATYSSTEYVLKTGGFSAGGSGSYTAQLDLTALDEDDAWLFTSVDSDSDGTVDYWTISCDINSATYYLGVTATNNGVTSLTSQSYGQWTLTAGSDNYTVLSALDSSSAARKLALYNGSTWRCYTSNSGVQNIILYEYSAPSKTVESLEVTTQPTKTTYTEGEALDLTGVAITANWSDSTTSDATSSAVFSPADGYILATSDTKVTVSYGGKTAEISLTVNAGTFSSEDMFINASLLSLGSYSNDNLSLSSGFVFGRTDVCISSTNGSSIQLKASTGMFYNKSIYPAAISKIYFLADADNEYTPSNWAVYASTSTAGETSTALTITEEDSTNRVYSVDFTGGTYYYFTLAKTGSYACYFDGIVVELVHSDDDVSAVRTAATNMLTVFAEFCSAEQGPSSEQWSTISGYYSALTADQQAIFDAVVLNTASCNSSDSYGASIQGTDLQKAVQKIEYCVSAYGVTNFTNRTISSAVINPITTVSSNSIAMIITIVSIIALSAVGAFFLLRKKKEQ